MRRVVSVRKMRHDERSLVERMAKGAGPAGALLAGAAAHEPHCVRIVHMGDEVFGAFVLHEMPGGVEEVEALTLTDEGHKTGAERALIEYVVSAARFARKKAVEVVVPQGTDEARHLEAEGFAPTGPAGAPRRYRLDLKKR